ncbi:MAG: tRNA (adenosine(37)-N6)-dimethylallyltransferase MiaA [Bacteroidetes bacterium]|nr:tRNA (adenosine(37)-N6)-dimethylallyltransferase MiaA [Bacteroidota bacterium]
MDKTLIIIIGSTGVGKTDMSIEIGRYFNAHIVCGDSRQVYKEMTIGTATPTNEEKAQIPHHLFQYVSALENYNVGRYESEAMEIITELFKTHKNVLLVGGSGMYIDAVCKGIDDMPDVDKTLREELNELWKSEEGRKNLLEELKNKDSEFYDKIDKNNRVRVIRAIEVCRSTGSTYTSIRKGKAIKRPFNIVKIGVERDRAELYDRINKRVDMMIEQGLEEEARSVYHLREYNSLQTVGYRELFDYFDGTTTKEEAIELIKRNSRRYAKRQMTWFRRDETIKWFSPNDIKGVTDYITSL